MAEAILGFESRGEGDTHGTGLIVGNDDNSQACDISF